METSENTLREFPLVIAIVAKVRACADFGSLFA